MQQSISSLTPRHCCRWDFCHQTFPSPTDLLTHLHADHVTQERPVELFCKRKKVRKGMWIVVDPRPPLTERLPLGNPLSQTTGGITTTSYTQPYPPSFPSQPLSLPADLFPQLGQVDRLGEGSQSESLGGVQPGSNDNDNVDMDGNDPVTDAYLTFESPSPQNATFEAAKQQQPTVNVPSNFAQSHLPSVADPNNPSSQHNHSSSSRPSRTSPGRIGVGGDGPESVSMEGGSSHHSTSSGFSETAHVDSSPFISPTQPTFTQQEQEFPTTQPSQLQSSQPTRSPQPSQRTGRSRLSRRSQRSQHSPQSPRSPHLPQQTGPSTYMPSQKRTDSLPASHAIPSPPSSIHSTPSTNSKDPIDSLPSHPQAQQASHSQSQAHSHSQPHPVAPITQAQVQIQTHRRRTSSVLQFGVPPGTPGDKALRNEGDKGDGVNVNNKTNDTNTSTSPVDKATKRTSGGGGVGFQWGTGS